MSRGAKEVVFIENYVKVLPILKKNLLNLKSVKNYKIIEANIYYEKTLSLLNQKFDIIFLDPPYQNKNLEKLLSHVKSLKLLNKNGILILHRNKNENDIFPKEFRIFEEKKYGISKIIFISL